MNLNQNCQLHTIVHSLPLCTVVVHNTEQNRSDNLSSYPPVSHHYSTHRPLWTDPTNVISQWWDEWKSALVVNCSLVDDPTIWQPVFNQPWHYWALLNHFWTNQGHCAVCILSKEVGSCSNQQVPLWQMTNDVVYCQQVPTVQAGGGCSDCTQPMTLLPNG